MNKLDLLTKAYPLYQRGCGVYEIAKALSISTGSASQLYLLCAQLTNTNIN